MIDKKDLQISGRRVLQKEYTDKNKTHYVWGLIAEFHFKKGNPSPETMAKIFYNAISK